ncbi:MAG: hypothetical protein N5P05_000671 [Chroococcopsis gigantea SAG 12.99]|jgi:uncharacterized membrane protein|nr:glycosyltransferase family 39 protein [Chlorogloea purpurea SAG 13.99]MDV2999065.1 hypothetical protein [Chroococcopsis gigantea SAG 12.99]
MKRSSSFWFTLLIVAIIALGVFFRIANLEKKVFWHDEAYTVIRATGYEARFISEKIFANKLITAGQLNQYQKEKPGSNAYDTVKSLAIEDPQHPPFYFLGARYWSKIWGYSLMSARILPVIISLLSIPFIYLLSLELFNSKLAAWLAVFFLTLSPVEIIFAQIARQYSLLTMLTLLSWLLLVRSLKIPDKRHWMYYAAVSTLGLYTHLFFGLVTASQGFFIFSCWLLNKKGKTETISIQNLTKFSLSIGVACLLYLPWVIVFALNSGKAFNSTNWAQVQVLDLIFLLKLWLLSFSCTFSDIFFGFDNIFTYVYRFIFFIITIFSLYFIYKRCRMQTFLLISIAIFMPFVLLAIPDILLITIRSSVTRYLLSCFPGIYLAVGFLIAANLQNKNIFPKLLLIFLLLNSTVSNIYNTLSDTTWAKIPSYSNGEIARQINSSPPAILISDEGSDGTNIGDLLSLSYLLKPDTGLFLAGNPVDVKGLKRILETPGSSLFIFRPSNRLLLALDQFDLSLDFSPPIGKLKKLQN